MTITIPQSINFFNIFLCFRIFYSFSMILFHLFLTYLSFIQTNPKPTLDSLFLCICTFFSINHTTNISLFFHYFSLLHCLRQRSEQCFHFRIYQYFHFLVNPHHSIIFTSLFFAQFLDSLCL